MKITKFILLSISFSAIVGLSNVANAQCTIDQSQLSAGSGLGARNLPGSSEGQTFMAGATGLLCEIDLLMANAMTGTGTLKIYSGSGTAGTLLATQSVTVNVPSGQVWQNWTISSPPSVTKGAVYTFQFIPAQGSGLPDPYVIMAQTENVYSGGYWLSNPTGDLTFRTYIKDITTGLNDIPRDNQFMVYPNPSKGKFTISNSADISSIEIYNYLGVKVLATRVKQQILNEIDLSNAPKGIYSVKIYNGTETFDRKIVVQ